MIKTWMFGKKSSLLGSVLAILLQKSSLRSSFCQIKEVTFRRRGTRSNRTPSAIASPLVLHPGKNWASLALLSPPSFSDNVVVFCTRSGRE